MDPWQRLREWLQCGPYSCEIVAGHSVTLRRHGSAVPVVAELVTFAHSCLPHNTPGFDGVRTTYMWCGTPDRDSTIDEVLTAALNTWNIGVQQ